MTRFAVRKAAITVAFMFVLVTSSLFAQDTSVLLSQADDLSNRSQWPEAAEKYSAVVKVNPANGYAWHSLGECLLQMKKYDQAAEAESNAIQHNFRPLLAKVSLARIAAAQGDREKALQILSQIAVDPKAPALRPVLVSAAEFDGLKSDPKYKEIYASMKPCATPEYRQFDFWVGNWKVRSPAGEVVGTNDVTLEQEGCLIVEHWKSSEGVQTGTSFNYYDIRDKQWHQLYIDNSGNAGAFPAMSGALVDNRMVLLTDAKDGPVSRWTWYLIKPGIVRQMAEQTTDKGAHWVTTWDSTYSKN